MSESFATVDELQSRWSRTLTADERTRAEILLADASRRLRNDPRIVPSLDDGIADGIYDSEDAEVAVIDMVKRAMTGEFSDGVEQVTETAGPFTKSIRYSTKGLFISTSDLYNWFGINNSGARTVWVS
jgi:hypothetical protein